MWKKRDDIVKLDGIAVEKIMEHRGISRYELARLIKRDKNEVKLWVTGERHPTWPNAHMIAEALDCEKGHLTGEKPFVPEFEPETDSIPSGDTPSSVGAGGKGTLADKGILGEVEVDENDLASWNAEQKDSFLSAIGVLLKLGCPVRLVGRPREGSVKLNLRLTRPQWERLEQAFAAGELAHLKVTKVEPFYDPSEDQAEYSDLGQPDMARLVRPDANKIIILCNEKGWEEAELSNAANIALATARRIMFGRECFRYSLSRVSAALGVPIDVLLEGEKASAPPGERRYEFHIYLPIDRKNLGEEKLTALFDLLKKLIGATGDVEMTELTVTTTIVPVSLTLADSFRLIVAMTENRKQLLEQLGATTIRIDFGNAFLLSCAIYDIPDLYYPSPAQESQESIAQHKEVPIKQ